jgi:hypothetical protein
MIPSSWDDVVDGSADGACRGLPVMDGDFDPGLIRLRICFILEIGRYGMKQGSRCAFSTE